MNDDRRAWADLPLEILTLIRQPLSWEDDCNFRATCRGWNFTLVLDPIFYKNVRYPFLLRFSKNGSNDPHSACCEVYSATHNKTYHVRAPTQLGGDAHIFCSNYGWLLLGEDSTVFFYHPITERIIKLPRSSTTAHVPFNWMSFSAPPTSPDCVVMGFRNSESQEKTNISFIRRGQSSWKHYNDVPNRMGLHNYAAEKLIVKMIRVCEPGIRQAKRRRRSSSSRKAKFMWSDSTCSPVFYRGAFYCLARDGRLGVFDPKRKKKNKMWRLLPTRFMDDDPQNQQYLVECKGELISIVVAPMGKLIRVFRFSERRQVWRILDGLKDQMVFLSSTGCIAVTCDNGQVERFANTIHFPRLHEGRHMFYSVSTEQFRSFGGDYISDDLYETKLALNHAWVIPKFSIPLSEQQYNVHQHYIIRNLSLLPPRSSGAYSSGSQQLEAPVGEPCFLFGNKEGGRVLINLCEENSSNNHSRNAELVEIIENKVVLSSAHGTLVLVNSSGCYLLDPRSMIETPLPKWEFEKTFIIGDAVLLLPPDDDAKLLAVLFGWTGDPNGDIDTTMVWRDGDEKWTVIEMSSKQAIDPLLGAVAHRGKIYGFYPTYDLAVTDLQHGSFIFELIKEVEFPKPLLAGTVCYVCKLVQSCDELLLFVRYYQYGCRLEDELMSTPTDIKVFKMDWELLRWEMLDDLGDRAFFWCSWACYPCCASKSGFQRNSIFFIEARDMKLYVFDYENRTISTSRPCPNIDDWPLGPLCFMWYK